MSSIWTPGGERPVGDEPTPQQAGGGGEPSPEEVAAAQAKLREVREELSRTPVADIVANHAIGLWQLAVLHLGLDGDESSPHEPNLPEARLAIDALAALVEGVHDRLGEHAEALEAALANLRMAFVQVSGEVQERSGAAEGDESE